jgi:PAS domain S-box-containing protein
VGIIETLKLAHERLDHPLELFAGLFASTHTAVALYDQSGKCVLVNDAFRGLFGAEPPPNYCLFDDPTLHAQDGVEPVRRAFAGETVQLARLWYQHQGPEGAGPKVAVDGTVFPLRSVEGSVTHVAFGLRDVTAQARLQETLDELERFRDIGIIGVVHWSADGAITWANELALELLGFSKAELERGELRWTELTPPEWKAVERAAIDEIRRTGKSRTYEKEFQRRDGSRVPVLVACSLLPGATNRGVSFLLDISEQKKAALESDRQKMRFRALVEQGNELIVLFDPKHRPQWVAASVQRLLGMNEEQYLNTHKTMIHLEDLDYVKAAFARCVAVPESVVNVGKRLLHGDGTYRHFEGTFHNRLQDPAVGAVVGNLRDVTDKKALQHQFLQSQKMEAIGRLAGGVAHDFNNMLSAILGFAGIVHSELSEQDPLRSDVAEIVAAAERASSLTRQLLAFSRRQILEPQVLDLTEHIVSMEGMLRRLLGENVELHLGLAQRLGCVRADPAQIEQIVLNLVINARDALPPTGGRITIETANVELDEEYSRQHLSVAPGEHVLLSVADNGQGMEDSVRERIFEPFFTTKALGKGTGLGLATVFGIVKQSGGHIWLYSEQGRGSTFKVYLPRVQDAATAAKKAGPQARLQGNETILLVEDESGVRAFAKRALQREGYVVLEAENGGEALLIAEQHRGHIHLLLTDVVMPRMNGRALADRLLAMRPDLKVIYMSGYTENTIVHQGVLDEGTEFIPKPVSLEGLCNKVRQVLDRGR